MSCPPVVVADARVLQSRAIASGGWLAGLHPAWFSSAPRTEDRPALNSQLNACARVSSAVCANVSRETSRPFTTTATTQSKMQSQSGGYRASFSTNIGALLCVSWVTHHRAVGTRLTMVITRGLLRRSRSSGAHRLFHVTRRPRADSEEQAPSAAIV